MSDNLHVYTNGPDKVVAENMEQARALLDEYATEDFDDEIGEGMEVYQISDEQTITIFLEDEMKDYPQGSEFIDGNKCRVEATAKAWARWNKVGFLCTENY